MGDLVRGLSTGIVFAATGPLLEWNGGVQQGADFNRFEY